MKLLWLQLVNFHRSLLLQKLYMALKNRLTFFRIFLQMQTVNFELTQHAFNPSESDQNKLSSNF